MLTHRQSGKAPFLSPKQLELRERDARILRAARTLVLDLGYHGITMDHIAKASECPKGTLYHRFVSKEDILVALASDCLERRTALMRRGASYSGRSRERMVGLAESIALFTRLNPEDSRILHMTTGPVREKASPERIVALFNIEKGAVEILRGVLEGAVESGDLVPEMDGILDEIALGVWGLVEGSFTLIESGIPEHALGISDPFHKTWNFFNRSADAYNWRPLSSEWDYLKTLAEVRQAVFAEEAELLYGPGQWYGDQA